ncbi:MAG TPA: DUF962 domain-containing protein [Tepidiformaceae bacterium]|nr:DUF962 domain-containing protein [Tepidiformaceae bacterium]
MKCHGKTWENPRIRSFEEFWPYYVRQHSRPATRLLHAVGSVLAVVLFGVAFAVNLWILVAVPLVGYAFAWYAHFFVEHNRPATFGHPFYSLAADYRMLFLMMAGRMDDEVTRHCGASVAPPPSAPVRP